MSKRLQRTKRINLDSIIPDQFISEWQDCYILVRPKPYTEIQKMQADFRKLNKKSEKLSRNENKLTKKLDTAKTEQQIESIEKELDKNTDALEQNTNKIVELTDKIIRDSFVGGMIKDDKDKLVDLVADDLYEFDIEVKQHIAQHITGSASKNA